MKFEEFITIDECHDGNIVWVCDYRYNDYSKKPIRHLKPTKVKVCSKGILPKNEKLYYTDIFFMSIKGNKIIKLYDNTGYRSFPGIAVQVFLSEEESFRYYSAIGQEIIQDLLSFKEKYIENLDKRIFKIREECLLYTK